MAAAVAAAGSDVLQNLQSLVWILTPIIGPDENNDTRVRRAAALSIAALAEAASPDRFDVFRPFTSPDRFEVFRPLLNPIWRTMATNRGMILVDFSISLCAIFRLMDANYTTFCAAEVLQRLPCLLHDPLADEEEKKEMRVVALKIMNECLSIAGQLVDDVIRFYLVPEFFKRLWVRNLGLERGNYKLLIDATIVMASRVGVEAIYEMIVEQLQHEGGRYVEMVMDTVDKAFDVVYVPGSEKDPLEEVYNDMDYLFTSSS